MRLFPHTKNTSIKIITDTYDLERCFLSSHSQGSLHRKGWRFFMDLSLSEELQRFLSPVVLQDIARQVGFVKRSSKYQANELIALCVWLSQEIASTSLTQLCSRLEASTGVLMSPEGLNQRFNPAAVAFLREVFTSLLTQKLCSNQSLSAHMISIFNRIRILDATVPHLVV
ncbi:hypothetical protein BTGOE7_19030 [Bacillus thuringiensis]|nr:hypothetical protein BTGOE7_19030 [Bacillus thuringiensis]